MPSQPLYKQVKDRIIEGLVRHEWQPGDVMPSERHLAARYEVGVSTIRAAMGELAASGVVVRTQGKGTYVAHHSARGNVYRFFNVVRQDGRREDFHRELLTLRRERADVKTAARLQFPRGTRAPEVFRLRIRLTGEHAAFAYAEITIPVHLFAELDSSRITDGPASLYALYQADYGVNIIRVMEDLYAVRAGAAVGRALSIDRDESVLRIERVAFTFNDMPVELRTTWVHTRDYHYAMAQGADR